ncbi:unnamed protein product [Tilletia controversa]|nr:unnamed protein product [Tilletia controversa]
MLENSQACHHHYEPESVIVSVKNDDSFDPLLSTIFTEEEQVAIAVSAIIRTVINVDSTDTVVDYNEARGNSFKESRLMSLALDSFFNLLLADREKDQPANSVHSENEAGMLFNASLVSFLNLPLVPDHDTDVLVQATLNDGVISTIALAASGSPGSIDIDALVHLGFLPSGPHSGQRTRSAKMTFHLGPMFAFLDDDNAELLRDLAVEIDLEDKEETD